MDKEKITSKKIAEYKRRINESKNILKTDKTLACYDIPNIEDDIKELRIKIANLNGMKEIKGYRNLSRFKKNLVDLIFDANKNHLKKLKKAYPELVKGLRE